MGCGIARAVLVLAVAGGVTSVSSGGASAQGTGATAASPAALISAGPAAPPPGPPPDCKHHPSFPACKKQPAGSSPTPKP
jgi:hypothetical protein